MDIAIRQSAEKVCHCLRIVSFAPRLVPMPFQLRLCCRVAIFSDTHFQAHDEALAYRKMIRSNVADTADSPLLLSRIAARQRYAAILRVFQIFTAPLLGNISARVA